VVLLIAAVSLWRRTRLQVEPRLHADSNVSAAANNAYKADKDIELVEEQSGLRRRGNRTTPATKTEMLL